MKFFKWLLSLIKKEKPGPVSPPIFTTGDLQKGYTVDSVDLLEEHVRMISSLGFRPSIRIVFDFPLPPKDYAYAVEKLSEVATIVGQPCDSTYAKKMTPLQYKDRFKAYVQQLPWVSIWEIGNEVNGDWAGANTALQTELALQIAKAAGKKVMLTPYWNTEICADTHGQFIPWLEKNLSLYVKNNCDYVCTSFYGYDCDNGAEPSHGDISAVLAKLAVMFYPAKVGIGEYGKEGNAKIMRHYLDYRPPSGLPFVNFGGYWYGFQDLVKSTKLLQEFKR